MELPKFVITSKNCKVSLDNELILLVNIASECHLYKKAFPKMYELAKLHPTLIVLAYPSNDFNQESLSPDSITSKLIEDYGPIPNNLHIMNKVRLIGKSTEPIFKYVQDKSTYLKFFTQIRWNYEKFIITPDGFVERFSPTKNWNEVNFFINGFC